MLLRSLLAAIALFAVASGARAQPIDDAIAEGPEHIFNALLGHVGECLVVIRRLYDDFVRANSVHAVKHAVGLAVEIPLDHQRGKFVRHHAHAPSW